MQQPLVRIIGMDGAGKTTICERLEALDSQVITFGSTPRYAYRWLSSYGVGKADKVTPDQIDIRQHVFAKMNEHEAYVHDDLRAERPVIAVRGRADTWISASALRGKAMPRDMGVLFPKDLRPDLLVVLTASPKAIEKRIDARGEAKTGANSMAYHRRTREMYTDLVGIARHHIPVLQYNTGLKAVTPDGIATDVLATMQDLQGSHALGRPAFKQNHDTSYARRQLAEKLVFDTLSDRLQADILQARNVALQQAYPRDKVTKAGCVLVSKGKAFTGANIKRWTWNSTTCCERLAIDNALTSGIDSIDRLVLFVTNIGGAMTGTISPCGPCRELLKEVLHHLGQSDLDIYMAGPDKHTVFKTTLSTLLPLSGTLTSSESWAIDD